MGCTSSTQNEDGSYNPSCLSLQFATVSVSDYVKQNYKEKYTGTKPILVVGSDEGLIKMTNGKLFNSGNHPIETYVPMLHMEDAGFTFDFATVHGNPIVLEMWAFPHKDENVGRFHKKYQPMMNKPKKLEDITNLDAYAGLYIPGGHGAMINLPSSVALGKLLNIAHERALPTVVICHGPAAYLASNIEGTGRTENCYKGYKTMCFTEASDNSSPSVGYLPGQLPWSCQGSIEAQGLIVVNTSETGATMVDRELITGDSPKACNNVGVLAAPLLVKYAKEHNL